MKTCDYFYFQCTELQKTSSVCLQTQSYLGQLTKRCTKLKDKIICFNSCWHRPGHPCRKGQFVESTEYNINWTKY